jgi:hypothetical protein
MCKRALTMPDTVAAIVLSALNTNRAIL